MEQFRDIPNYEGFYQVSDMGNVKSLAREVKNQHSSYFTKERILKPSINNPGYYSVQLSKKGEIKNKDIHQLVAIVFLNHIPQGRKIVVNHKDFNRLNNRADNLEVITQRENTNMRHIKTSSNYVGVWWHKSSKKWNSRIVMGEKQKDLGYFVNEIDASNAYQNALKQL